MRTLRAVFFVHGLITLAGAVVLTALTQPNVTMISNTVLRFAVVAVFLVVWWLAARRHQTPGTNR
jgi:uncharacterized membrane protein